MNLESKRHVLLSTLTLLALLFIFSATDFATAAASEGSQVIRADVCVYGGTSEGVVAAVQSRRMGKSVVILEPGKHLGGVTSGGPSAVDIGRSYSVGGIAREFFTQLASKFGHRCPTVGRIVAPG